MMRKFLALIMLTLLCVSSVWAESYIYKISLLSLDDVTPNTDVPVVIYAGGNGGYQSFLKDNTTNYTHDNGTYEAEIKNGTTDRAAWVFTLRKAEDGTITLKDSHDKYLAKNSSGSKANVAGTESNQDAASFTCTLQDETNKKYRLSYNIDETTYRVVRNAGPIALDPSGDNWVDAQFYTFCATDFVLPFKVSESVENATWYTVKQSTNVASYWQVANDEATQLGKVNVSSTTIDPANADQFSFCFVANDDNTFYIYNKKTGKAVYVDNEADYSPVKISADNKTAVKFRQNGSSYNFYVSDNTSTTICAWSNADNFVAISAGRADYSGSRPTFTECKTYNIEINGTEEGRLVINGQEYAGGSILVPTISNIATYASAKQLAGYATSVSLNNNTITVTYNPGRNVTYNITATNNGENPISWSETKFVSDEITDASVVLAGLSYEFFSDFIITDEDKTIGDEDKTFTVTASHNLPMVPGKFYQIKCSKGYLSYVDNSNVSVKAATNNTDSKNLWYIKQSSANAPVFSLCNVESGKAVHGTSNGNGACESIEEFAYEMYDATNGQFGLVEPGTDQNLGAYGNYPTNSPNGGLGRWLSGHDGTAYTAEIFDLVFPTQEFANYVGGYASSPSYYTALATYNTESSAANLKNLLTEYNALETIELTANAYYRLRNVGSIGEEGGNKHPYSWLTSTLGEQNHMAMSHEETPEASAIFYYDGESLKAYNNGKYASGATTSDEAYAWQVEKFADSPVASYIFKNGTNNYLTYWGYDSNNNNPGALMKTQYENWAAWYLQEVPMYSVSINDFEATVETEDNVQVKNGGKLYIAEGATLTATEAKQWYTCKITKNDAAKTVTITYSDPSGYYFIKDSEGNYATNNFETENATAFGTKVNAYNGMWKATFDEDNHTVSINSGVGTPLYVGENTYNVLTLTAQNDNGTYTATSENDAVWTLEPVNLGARKIASVTVFGDEGAAWLIFNHNSVEERSKDGGFFLINGSNDFGGNYSNLSGTEVTNKQATISVKGNLNYQDVSLAYANADDLAALKEEICAVYPLLNEIGYPRNPGDDATLNYTLFNMGYLLDRENSQGVIIPGADIDPALYAEFAQALNIIYSSADVVLPTNGGFYNLIDFKGNSKTYYLTEEGELLSYDNGLFTKIGVGADGAFVDYAGVGTTTGENFEFSKSTAGFGKLAAWQLGEGPLPSGDGRINSGWFVTKAEPIVKTHPTTKYGTFYCPVPAKLLSGKAYTVSAEQSGNNYQITLTEIEGGIIPAETAVIVEKVDADVQVTTELTSSEKDGITTLSSDLCGTAYTIANTPANVESFDSDCNAALTMTADGSKPVFKRYVGTNFNGFKAFLPINYDGTTMSNIFDFIIAGGDDLTGMNNVIIKKVNTPIRDLNGNIITNPIKGQIYIQNGKAFKY